MILKSGVLLPATMGTLSSNQLQWQGNSTQNGFDAIPNQAMQLTTDMEPKLWTKH